ncbi:MAG: hypothetical protein P1U86_06970 [Verrucomicrobiales bacterium]|nr:hypothetical protein [Verrucomicrobiales bacterium]
MIFNRHCQSRRGFALITTLLLLVLAVMLVVALLSLRMKEGSKVSSDRELAAARANALYALDLAMGELQRYAGPDQAVSGSASLLEESAVPNPHWTGIWSSTEAGRSNESVGAFLVSGNEKFDLNETTVAYPAGYLDPLNPLDPGDPDVLELVKETTNSPARQVLVERQDVPADADAVRRGHYAYWVGDEGVKARVDIRDPFRNDSSDEAKSNRLRLAQRVGSEAVLPDLNTNDERLDSVTSLEEIELLQASGAAPGSDVAREKLHDLTTLSTGLLTDLRKGGLKQDLTLAFENDEVFERLFGAEKTGVISTTAVSKEDVYKLDLSRLNDFYLVPEILETATKEYPSEGAWVGGPNWGNLREYFLLYREPETHFPFLPHPRCAVRMRQYAFNPYKHANGASAKYDYYQRNSPVSPVLSRAQMNVRLRSRKVGTTGAGDDEEDLYEIDLEIQPVIGIWNPHNIAFTDRIYRFDWEISVYLDLKVNGTTRRYDLYRLWNNDTPWFSLNTQQVNLQPGEMRLFTIDTRRSLSQRVTLVPRWSDNGAFRIALPETPPAYRKAAGPALRVTGSQSVEIEEVGLVAPPASEGWSGALKDLQKHNTFMAIKYGESVGSASSAVESSSVRMNNLWKADDESGPAVVPAPGDAIPPFQAARHLEEPAHLAAWSYTMRTSREDDLGHRNFIDSNVRAIAASSRWDGSVEDRGWRSMGWLNDGAERALLPPGNVEPEADGLDRYRAFGGNAIGAGGQNHLILFDVPREPLVSVGQLQHANIGRYNNEPSFVVGNSYQNVRIPLDQTEVRDFADHDDNGIGYETKKLDVFDLSYLVNEVLWDSWFFSTFEYSDVVQQFADLKAAQPLPNSRYRLYDPDESLEGDDFGAAVGDDEAYRVLGARFLVEGAFNVNSTSVEAWKAVLHSMSDLVIPEYDVHTGSYLKEERGKVVFSRFVRPFGGAFHSSQSPSDESYWRGYRELDSNAIDELAVEIVRQVKMRGPFRSMADFVNRSLVDLDSSSAPQDDTRLSGALQSALDRVDSINAAIDPGIASPVAPIPDPGNEFHDVPEAATQGTGFPGYLLQGDILQALAPTLTARSDTFRIRTYGDRVVTPGSSGGVEVPTARVWCEAIVQRLPEPLEPLDAGISEARNLIQSPEDVDSFYTAKGRTYFGRRFRVISFRWLREEDL